MSICEPFNDAVRLVGPPAEMLIEVADALGTSVDYPLTGNQIEDAKVANIRLFRRFQALETPAEPNRDAIIRVIDAMVVKHQTTLMVEDNGS